MDFELRKGQLCVIRMSKRETEAVRIAVSNLAKDLEQTLNLTVQVIQDDINQEPGQAPAKILVRTLDGSDTTGTGADCGCLRREAYQHSILEGQLVITGSDRPGTNYGKY
ncbi:MAG: hypothetical protein K2P40_16590, partial [Lachnospiraceae bacterium]|nr:hypothetical protein [Lachnospiraceae bacterium]